MGIHFNINKELIESLSWEEYEAFEAAQEGEIKLRTLRPLLARFMTDEANKPLPHAQAMKELAPVKVGQIKDVVAAFGEALKGNTIPLGSGNPSNSPLPVATETLESQPG